ncbi:unnamed protein product [Vitrella brassicaformis CCMP3155]|uniref:Uncharacterized protein n=1 Tax=Vitrella brassicaformis (strain CCMP3155) TaxID=1169540 RepID=A0A0G4G5H9_VITBC|nr:unnamed protein product [Vitrella brassicaformis CCMP3155]|eukprot:CEM23822.1 unnamed protein product [Vitrella brassicaformis CCMP3155]
MASGSAEGQQPDGCLGLEDIEIAQSDDSCDATRRLAEGIFRRTFTHQQQVTNLIHNGADPNREIGLRVRGSGSDGWRYRLLSLAIDNLSDNAMWTGEVTDSNGGLQPFAALPHWSSPELEAVIINSLIDGGARVNRPALSDDRPIKMAIRLGNEEAVRVLLAHGAPVRPPDGPLLIMELPKSVSDDRIGQQVSLAYEQRLLSIYRRLILHDATLATERDLISSACSNELGRYSQAFIDSYLDLLVDNGANVTAVDAYGCSYLHKAAGVVFGDGAPCMADNLCRHLLPADINRETRFNPNETPLYVAGDQLDLSFEILEDDDRDEWEKNQATRKIPLYETIIRSLLRSGADIGRIPTDTEHDRRFRDLVLPHCTTVLNTDVHTGAMAAVNAALAPQRSLAAFLMRSLPTLLPHLLQPPGTPAADPPPAPLPAPPGYGPHEAEAIGWRIAAMCFDQDAANEAITANIVIRHSDMARRVCAAVDHFIKSALYASSNREVVGGTANVGGVTVRVPLQCFAIRADSRPHQVVHTRGRVGVREVVQRARLDEAARHGIQEGAINKGFNDHLGNEDCQYGGWQQLGRIDERGQWVTLGIN